MSFLDLKPIFFFDFHLDPQPLAIEAVLVAGLGPRIVQKRWYRSL